MNDIDNHGNAGARRLVVLTGGTSGIGRATVEELLRRDFDVIAVGRNPERCEAVERELQTSYPAAWLRFLVADLATTWEVRRVAEEIRRIVAARPNCGLDALINNAGVASTWRMVTSEGFEQQFAVNHLAGFLLTQELMPILAGSGEGRVLAISSGSHRRIRMNWDDLMFARRYSMLRAYRQSKLANVLFCAELNRRYAQETGVRAYAIDPGLVRTDIGFKSSSGIEHFVWQLRTRSRQAIAPAESARHIVSLATEEPLHAPSALYRCLDQVEQADSAARDPVAGERLWAISERLCSEPARAAS